MSQIYFYVTLGWIREDGDIQVMATLNNADEHMSNSDFCELVEVTRKNIGKRFDPYQEIEVFERQDAPDYVTPDDAD